jgi:hypothetical protein
VREGGPMAIVINSIGIEGLRRTHFEQLRKYLLDAEVQGTYYGNYGQYLKRHFELKVWLTAVIELLSDEGIIVPKKEAP